MLCGEERQDWLSFKWSLRAETVTQVDSDDRETEKSTPESRLEFQDV
jgi:hypothetical protein